MIYKGKKKLKKNEYIDESVRPTEMNKKFHVILVNVHYKKKEKKWV